MATEVGQVNINLRLSLAKFSQDVQDGSNAAKKGIGDMSAAISYNSREATGSLALIGEEIGINIPRHIRTFIADIPGVGTALSAAFSSVAVLALIEVIVKVVEKVMEYRDHLAEAAEAWDKAGQQGTDALRALDEQLLSLQIRTDELNGNHVAVLKDQLKQIDNQTLTQIGQEMVKLGQVADDAFKKMQVGWLASLAGLGNDGPAKQANADLKGLIQTIQELTNAGNGAGIGDAINGQIIEVMNKLGDLKNAQGYFKTETGPDEAVALQHELDQLNQMYSAYQKIEKARTANGANDTTEALKKAREEADKLAAALQKVQDYLGKQGVSSRTSGGANPYLPAEFVDASAIANSPKLPGSGTGNPLYGGTKEAKDQLDLTTDLNEQILRGQELFTSTRTEAEKYANEMHVLNTLLASGAISQDTYNRAVTQAKAKYDDVSRGLQQIGDTVGRDISQAALYGGSWTKAFQDIAAEIVKVVIQMTILKSLQNASAASGGGGFLGFLTSITGGLAGKAVGGPVYQGQGYVVGESGPEFFSPTTSGQIIPNGLMKGSGGPPVVNNFNEFNFSGVTDADTFRKSQSHIAAEMAAMLSRAAQRNG